MNQSSGLAIGSLVCGILALPFTCCCGGCLSYPLALAAIVLGIIEIVNINKGTSSAGGKVMAMVGIGLGLLALVLAIGILVLGVGLNMAQMTQNGAFNF